MSIGNEAIDTTTLAPASQLHPLFPVTRPTPHHQPYYESCVVQQQQQMHMQPILPVEMIFPPLPPSGYQRVQMAASTSSASSYREQEHSSFGSEFSSSYDSEPPRTSSPLLQSSSSGSSASFSIHMPELTPNGSSSSPPLLPEDHPDVITPEACDSPPRVYPDNNDNGNVDADDDNKLFSEMLSADALEPGFTLSKFEYYQSADKGKQKAVTPPRVCLSFLIRCPFGADGLTVQFYPFAAEIYCLATYGPFTHIESKTKNKAHDDHDNVQGTLTSPCIFINDHSTFPFTTLHASTKNSLCTISPALPCSHPSIAQRSSYESVCQPGTLQIEFRPSATTGTYVCLFQFGFGRSPRTARFREYAYAISKTAIIQFEPRKLQHLPLPSHAQETYLPNR